MSTEQVTCDCGKELAENGMPGHLRSKAHLEWERQQKIEEIDRRRSGETDVAIDKDAPTTIPGVSQGELEEALAEIERLKGVNEDLRKAVAHHKPFVDIPVFDSVEDVIEQLGEKHWLAIGEVALAAENKKRVKDGMRPLYDDNLEHYDRLVREFAIKAAREMVTQQQSWTQGVARGEHQQLRTCKMVNPKRICDHESHSEPAELCYVHGNQVQIPVELQINNGAASLADPIVRYQRKGFKMMNPVRCRLVDCWVPQAVGPDGKPAFGGYCSQLHERFIEGSVLDVGDDRNPVTLVADYA